MGKTLKILLGIGLAIGITVFAFLYVKGSTVLNKEKKVRAYFPNVEGLIEASPLLLKGFQVGHVTRIELNGDSADYKVMVTFLLTTDIKIPEKSQAKIISMDLLQNKGVELILSNETNPMAKNEILLGFTEESFKDKINKEIGPLRTKADSLISSVDSAMSIFREIKASSMQKNVVASFESIKKTIIVLKQTSGKVDTIVGTDNSIELIMKKVNSISANLTKNKATIARITANFDQIVDTEAKAMVTKTMDEVNKAVADAAEVVSYVNSGKGTAGKFIKSNGGIQGNLDKASKNLELLLKEVIANPDRFFHLSVLAPKKSFGKADSVQ